SITADPAPTKFEIPFNELPPPPACTYSTSGWAVWFWPLAILLAAMLIFLLLITPWRRRDQDNSRRGWLRLRGGDWHFLFWPVLALFILEILVRVFGWYCIIPPWIFLASLLVWLVMLVLVSFTPENDTRLRPWWLVILLALLIPVCYFIFPNWWPALILVDLLALAWLIFSWRPLPPAAIGISLSLGSPQLPPVDDSVVLPVKLKLRGNLNTPSSLSWNCSVTSSNPIAGWKITPERADSREYQLTVYGIGDATTIDVELSADTEVDGQRIKIPEASTTIYLPLPAFNLAVRDSSELLEGAVTLSLEVDRKGQAESDSSQWDVQEWHVTAAPSGKDLSNEVMRGVGRGRGSLVLSGISSLLDNTTRVQVSADVKVDGQVVQTPQATATIRVIPIPGPIPVMEKVYEQIDLNLELPSCIPFDQPITLQGSIEYKGRERISSITWDPNVQILPVGSAAGATVRFINEESGELELSIDRIAYEKDNPAKEIQILVCGDAVLSDGRSIQITGKPATIEMCRDDLTKLEGIGPYVAGILNDHGIYTFQQLSYTELWKLNQWMESSRKKYKFMDPKTWPQQAKLANIAQTSGREEDQKSFKDYMDWVIDGIEPDEHDLDEKDRRPVALEWHGTAELMEKAYPDIKFPTEAERKEMKRRSAGTQKS
ncbi:MAG: hypothetical protein ACM3XO_03300, partial [Bacteroidota bacterium]